MVSPCAEKEFTIRITVITHYDVAHMGIEGRRDSLTHSNLKYRGKRSESGKRDIPICTVYQLVDTK
jgi:hypothetical protein